MIYSRPTRKRYSPEVRAKNRRFQARLFSFLFLLALICILIGFVIGRITVKDKNFTPEVQVSEPLVQNTPINTPISEPTPSPELTPEPTPEESPEPEPAMEYLGEYKITAYCACEKCCGEWAKNRPGGIVYGAFGVELQAGISVASPLPFGTKIFIEGIGEYTVQDRTAQWVVDANNGKIVDIYFDNHDAACKFGCVTAAVYIVNNEMEEKQNDQMQ